VRGGVSNGVAEELIALAGLDIPVYRGGASASGVSSAASEKIKQASFGATSGNPFVLVTGGAVQDVAQALKDGANGSSLIMHSLLQDTSNQNSTEDTRTTASFVQARVKVNNVSFRTSRLLLQPVAGRYSNGTKFVNDNRGVRAWDRANSPAMIKRTVELNTFQGFDTGHLRIADVIAAMQYFGVNTSDGNAMFSIMQHGLDLMKARQG
jgi:hypothetical protein